MFNEEQKLYSKLYKFEYDKSFKIGLIFASYYQTSYNDDEKNNVL